MHSYDEDNEGAHSIITRIKCNKLKFIILLGCLFEELDNLVEQFPDNSRNDNEGQTVPLVFSDVHTSRACIPDSGQQSSGSHLSNATTMPSSESPNDSHADTATVQSAVKTDHDICVEFYERTCGCQKADGKPCSSLFPLEHFIDMRSQASLMTCQELDLVLMTTIYDHDAIVARGRHKPVKRCKITSHFMHNVWHVCILMGAMYETHTTCVSFL